MSIVASNELKTIATPLLVRDDKVLLSANLVLVDTDSSDRVLAGDDLSLSVNDVNGDAQWFLTKTTIPQIIDDDLATYHYVEDIDVTNFPDGTITLVWTAQIGDELVQHQQCVDFHAPLNLTFVHGRSETESDYCFSQNTTKRIYHRFKNALGSIVDPDSNSARLKVVDVINSVDVATLTATRESEGLYYIDFNPSDSIYDVSKDQYCIYWEGQIPGGDYTEVQNSRRTIIISPESYDYYSDNLTYTTNQDIRTFFPTIDEFLARENLSIPEREMIVNQRRVEANAIVKEMYGRYDVDREILRQMEGYMVIKNILFSATAFSRLPESYIPAFKEKIKSLDKIITGKNVVLMTRMI